MIDDIDRKILDILQADARISNSEIARQVGMAPSALAERIRKLEERGVIRGYTTVLDPQKLGRGLLAYIYVRGDDRCDQETGDRLAALPEVQEVHHIAGEDCFLVKARVADTSALSSLLRDSFKGIESVQSTRTTIVLDSVKETSALPIVEVPHVA
jgi:Lrp/AsnC family transcriptional regulator, leucine-responsive regulatory protein